MVQYDKKGKEYSQQDIDQDIGIGVKVLFKNL